MKKRTPDYATPFRLGLIAHSANLAVSRSRISPMPRPRMSFLDFVCGIGAVIALVALIFCLAL